MHTTPARRTLNRRIVIALLSLLTVMSLPGGEPGCGPVSKPSTPGRW